VQTMVPRMLNVAAANPAAEVLLLMKVLLLP
jgi:hypothetical protein